MAVLPASKTYPRGGAPRRQYVKGAPLFARMALKFGGVDYPRGSELPVDAMSPHKHWELWQCGKADHLVRGPFDRKQNDPIIIPREVTNDAPIIEGDLPEGAAVMPGERIEQPLADAPALEDDPQPSKHRKRR